MLLVKYMLLDGYITALVYFIAYHLAGDHMVFDTLTESFGNVNYPLSPFLGIRNVYDHNR